MSSKRCDLKINKLVKAINSYPGIQTIMSCGGHKNPKVTHSQVPENEFYIEFGFTELCPTQEAWHSLNEIARSINEGALYEWARLSADEWVKIEVCKDESSIVYFRLHGHNVAPNNILVDMLERQKQTSPDYIRSLKQKTPHDQIKKNPMTLMKKNSIISRFYRTHSTHQQRLFPKEPQCRGSAFNA